VRHERGQASVEIVACCMLLALAAIAIAELLAITRARIEAERIADQAAVLVAEAKPIPAGLRARASIEQRGNQLQVRVQLPLTIPGGPEAETVTTRIAS
jgi:Flp pilus assembly protein TadG